MVTCRWPEEEGLRKGKSGRGVKGCLFVWFFGVERVN